MPDISEALDILLSPMLLISMVVLLFCVIVALKYDDGPKEARADRNREARDRYDQFLREKAQKNENE